MGLNGVAILAIRFSFSLHCVFGDYFVIVLHVIRNI